MHPVWHRLTLIGIALTLVPPATPNALADESISWLSMTETQEQTVMDFADGYKEFLGEARTELLATAHTVELVRAAGFRPLETGVALTPGARYYDVNRDRSLILIVVGERPPSDGVRIIASHIDSPRIELKGRPLQETEGFVLFQTNYHGGIKNYQWTNLPLALVGRVDKKDGTTVQVSVGLDPDDPVFVIPELSPHVDRALRERKAREVIAAEELDPLVGHIPLGDDNGARDRVIAFLESEYGIVPDDLVSAELALVPALEPRDVGFDRGLMAMYGQDDQMGAYASLRGLMDVERPPLTSVVHFADNEETGNVNNTGASSSYLKDTIGRLLHMELGEAYREPLLAAALRVSRAVSIDVNPGVNPIWPEAWEKTNAPRLGHGINIKLYGRGFDANSEYIAWFRGVLDGAEVPWQTTTYKVGRGGGGTLGREIARHNVDVIDIGAPLLSIHTPYSVSSKADVYWLYRTCAAFFAAP